MTDVSLPDPGTGEFSAPLVQVSDFQVQYPNARIGPISVEFRYGERVAVVGANGAGKSTLLKAMAGRLHDYGGRIGLAGTDLREQLPDVRASIGFLPENVRGLGWMSVAEHFEFLSHFFPTWDAKYAAELMTRLELPAESKVGTLSKGMAVKLALIAAEASRPPLLILDEPTSGIDPVMRGEILNTLNACAPAGGDRLVLYSSHILEDVEQVATRIVCIKAGCIVSDDSAADLRARHDELSMSEILYRTLQGTLEDPAPGTDAHSPKTEPRPGPMEI